MQNNPFEFSKEYWITRHFNSIPGYVVNYLKAVLNDHSPHLSKYFKRAFTRWMFNVIKNGKNPFSTLITAKELIVEKDLDYFFTTKGIPRPNLDWSWLDQKLKHVLHGFDPSLIVKSINVRLEGSPSKNFVFFDIEESTFKISRRQYDLAASRFNGVSSMFNEYLAILVSRYICIGTTNNHCSVPPHVIKFSGIRTELFGSPLNTTTDQYCSPMYDLERHFGSLGSFFNFDICSGTYLLNPPYDESIINEAMQKIFTVLNTNKEITVIVVLPIWDIETQIIVDRKFKNTEFPIIATIKENKNTRSHCLLNCNVHKFYNYYIDDYLPLADTHLFVMSNTVYNLTAQEIAKVWESGLSPNPRSNSSKRLSL